MSRFLRIIEQHSGSVVAERARVASTFLKRLVGLLLSKSLEPGSALLLVNCSGVHTLFMKFPIDVLYLDAQCRVIQVYENVKPWRLLPVYKSCRLVLELPAGTLAGKCINPGATLLIESLADLPSIQ